MVSDSPGIKPGGPIDGPPRILEGPCRCYRGTHCLPDDVKAAEIPSETADLPAAFDPRSTSVAAPDIDGHTLISEFKIDATMWKVYEDLRTREGVITFVSSKDGVRILRKSAEASFPE